MNLTRLYHEGAAARFWYDDTHAALHLLLGERDGDMMLAFLAATSPRANLRANVAKAMRAFTQWKEGEPYTFPGHFPAHRGNLTRAAFHIPLRGPKVKAFHAALTGDPDAVVLDVWMLRILNLPDRPTRAQWAQGERTVRRLAKRLNEQPRRVQAALWIAYKRRIEGPGSTVADYQTLIREHTT